MGNLLGGHARGDGARHQGRRQARPAPDLPAGRHPFPDRSGSERNGYISSDLPIMPTQVAAPTALLVASRAEQADVAVLLRGLGFHAVQVDSADAMNALREPLSLCLIDL